MIKRTQSAGGVVVNPRGLIEEALAPLNFDHPEARWVPIAEVPKLLTHPKDKEFF